MSRKLEVFLKQKSTKLMNLLGHFIMIILILVILIDCNLNFKVVEKNLFSWLVQDNKMRCVVCYQGNSFFQL